MPRACSAEASAICETKPLDWLTRPLTSSNCWRVCSTSAAAWINGQSCVAPTCELDVYDRVGSGDGFASGFFFGLLAGEPEQAALNLGWAHGALLTTFPGDTSMATLEQVRAFAQGTSARIQR